MESRFDWFRNTFSVVLGLIAGFAMVSPVTLKAIAMTPVLSLMQPSPNQEVSGHVAFYALANSEGVVSLQFQVDGEDYGPEITSGLCTTIWNSQDAADGLHTIQAVAQDEFSNRILSPAVTVRVNNLDRKSVV